MLTATQALMLPATVTGSWPRPRCYTATEGQRIEVRGCDLWTVRDGKVVKKGLVLGDPNDGIAVPWG